MGSYFTATDFDAQFLLRLVGIFSTGVLLAITGLSVMGAIAFWRSRENAAQAYVDMFVRGEMLRILTVLGIIFAASWLAFVDKIDSAATSAILSGIAGYVLGGLDGKVRRGQGDTTSRQLG